MRPTLTCLSATVLALAACGGGGDGERAHGDASAGRGRPLPVCAGTAPAVPAESSLPRDFPLPPGTRITSATTLSRNQVLIAGLIPADLQDAATFFSEMLPERGYQVGVGDAEATEAEAPFTGNGFRGRWRVNEIRDCPALTLTLVLIEQS
jgi:hypothetical protein